MAFVYHYHATHQDRPGTVTHFDGIVVATSRIDSMDRYREVKKAIADTDFAGVNSDCVTVRSLSFLHETE